MDPLRSRLRAATDDLHARVDSHPMLAALADGSADPDRVAAALSVLGPFFAGHEAAVAAWRPDLLPQPPVSARIAADLARLSRRAEAPPGAPATAADPGEAVGIAWVLAGSRQGAAVMAHRLASRSGPIDRLAFLSPHATDDLVWQRLLAALPAADPAGAVAGARATFQALLSALDGAAYSAR